MIPTRWVDLSSEEQNEIYALIDEANAEYMRAIRAPEGIEGYRGVTSKSWSPL